MGAFLYLMDFNFLKLCNLALTDLSRMVGVLKLNTYVAVAVARFPEFRVCRNTTDICCRRGSIGCLLIGFCIIRMIDTKTTISTNLRESGHQTEQVVLNYGRRPLDTDLLQHRQPFDDTKNSLHARQLRVWHR